MNTECIEPKGGLLTFCKIEEVCCLFSVDGDRYVKIVMNVDCCRYRRRGATIEIYIDRWK